MDTASNASEIVPFGLATRTRAAVAAAVVGMLCTTACEPSGSDGPDAALRTAWGAPDLTGTWVFRHTPLSRTRPNDIVVDPPDGRIPGLTAAAMTRLAAKRERMERAPRTPADRPPETRCIVGFNSGPPMATGAYNNLLRIVQAPGYFAILNEMVNDHRVIATTGGQHLAENVRFWKGDSRGRWEDATFVVETRNFTPHTTFWGSGPDMRLTERFTRIDRDTLRYQYTVHDPASFEADWSTEQHFVRTTADIYEYACHEGNRSLMLQMRAAKQQYEAGNATADDSWLPSWLRWYPTRAELLVKDA